jgi:aldose 1-epimerase
MDGDRIPLGGHAPFGEVGGREARLYTLENELLRVCVTDYGGILVSLEAPGSGGGREHVLLGFDTAGDYAANGGSFGALLGRNANRIAGGSLTIDGRTYSLSKNENGSTLHGGVVGFGKRFWSVAAADADHIVLRLTSADGDQGFPGEVEVTATYRLDGAALHLVFDARTTKPTPLSLSAHPAQLDERVAHVIPKSRVSVSVTAASRASRAFASRSGKRSRRPKAAARPSWPISPSGSHARSTG